MNKKVLFGILGGFGIFVVICILGLYFFRGNRSYDGGPYTFISGNTQKAMDSFLPVPSYEESASLAPDQMVNDAQGSKLQKNGSINLLVEGIDDAVDDLKAVNGMFGGVITNIYDSGRGNDRSVSITVKVPVDKFETYYEELRKIEGEVTYANVSTLDVTEEYIDITSRLSNLKSTEVQLVKILEKAESVTDILAVQRELNTVRGEIESYEQRKRYFDTQTDYSYITVSFSLDKTGLNVAQDEWKPWGEVKAAVKSLIEVLKAFVNMIIWIVIFSPVVLIPFFVIKYLSKRRKANQQTKMV